MQTSLDLRKGRFINEVRQYHTSQHSNGLTGRGDGLMFSRYFSTPGSDQTEWYDKHRGLCIEL